MLNPVDLTFVDTSISNDNNDYEFKKPILKFKRNVNIFGDNLNHLDTLKKFNKNI